MSSIEVVAVDLRELKALELAARSKIVFNLGRWLVPSQTSGKVYPVTLSPVSCACEDFQLRQQPCKHVIAARLVAERDAGDPAPPMDTTAVPKKPTYRQDWPKYNEAQTTEKHRFRELLYDLCQTLVTPKSKTGRGRQPLPLSDTIFAMAYKVYSTFSSRRFACDLKDALDLGFLTRNVHHNCINEYMESPDMTPILSELITRASLPLRPVESRYAVDSSGFSTSRFVRWYDEKYGCERSGHDWVKAHIITGCHSNIVVKATITHRDANDCPLLPELVHAAAANGFRIAEVSADKGYLSAENVETIASVGGAPFIAPKSNTTGAAGGLFERMFHYYQFRREEFLKHYHCRSNVESTFSMIKAKFRDHVRSRTDTSMVNESLCKILCHNIVVVHQSIVELGIDGTFFPASREPAPTVVKFPGVA